MGRGAPRNGHLQLELVHALSFIEYTRAFTENAGEPQNPGIYSLSLSSSGNSSVKSRLFLYFAHTPGAGKIGEIGSSTVVLN